MNYNMALLTDLEDNRKFALTYNRQIEEPEDLFRYGDVTRPIGDTIWKRFMTFIPRQQRPPDFLIDEDGYIKIERSSGNFCSQYTINNMKDQRFLAQPDFSYLLGCL